MKCISRKWFCDAGAFRGLLAVLAFLIPGRFRRSSYLFWVVVAMSPLASQAAFAAGGKEETMTLPPFLVETSKSVSWQTAWRYGRNQEFEILSRCPDARTREIAQSFRRMYRLLNVVLPPHFQLRFDVPKTFILYQEKMLPKTAGEMLAEAERTNPTGASSSRHQSYGMIRNPRLSDVDAMTVFLSLPDSDLIANVTPPVERGSTQMPAVITRGAWTNLTPEFVGYLLTNRTPALPAWFVSGFTGLFRKMRFQGDAVELTPVAWVSRRETRGLRVGKEQHLLSMPELLAGPAGTKEIDLWFAQAELFVRWGLDDSQESRWAAFWKFVDQASVEIVNEAMFKGCFGGDFAWATEQLRSYLRGSARKSVRLRSAEPDREPRLDLRDASDGEIARIKGDWERLAAKYVRSNIPELEPIYVGQARRTLRSAYQQGDRDPRLLAVLGLCEIDAGNEVAAREFLEKAVLGGVIRPRANLELARLRFNEGQADPAGPGGRLSAVQASRILAPLLAAHGQAPPLPEVYDLIATVWMNCEAAPQRSDLAVLDAGVRLFRRKTDLLYETAKLYAAQGWTTEAAALADLGLRRATNETEKQRFAQLRAAQVLPAE